MGNLQVRFLEGWAPAIASGYSTLGITFQVWPSLANNQGIDWRITLKLYLGSESENDSAMGTTSHVRVVLNYRLQKEHW
jgi:hypothetical protein